MIRVKRISILIALLLPLLTQNTGFACCGGGGGGSAEAYSAASDVFISRVVEVFLPPFEMHHNSDGSTSVSPGTKPGFVRLSVEKSYKGVQGSEVLLPLDGTSGGYNFEEGEEYLIYATRQDEKISTNKCSRTRLLSKATSDIKYMEGLEKGESQAAIYGYVLKEFIDQEGKPGLQTPFEELRVIAKSGDLRVEALADKSGEYELILLPGKYEVWVERLGVKVSRSDEVITLKDRDSNQKYLAVQLN
ncbi:MAG: hypothetical protein WBV94_33720 [Blastocatellia bacterium]